MIKLSPLSAHHDLRLPAQRDGVRISAIPPVRITALAPYPGQTDALRAQIGGFPRHGEVLTLGALRMVWAGRDLAFAFGDGLPDGLDAHCAMTDQSDGWAGFSLTGARAQAYLARRLPFDLRALPDPASARSVMGHIPVLVLKGKDLQLWVWRSMAQSALHDLTHP